ncbi:MAG TPA: DMT family transporter [Hyphomicrobiaceae bacterium]|nr:DMT family transporter [Hyphomicrobiaceae bacterium]
MAAEHGSELKAALAAAIGSICVGFTPLFFSGLHNAGLETVTILFYRYLVALCVLVPIALSQVPSIAEEWRRGGAHLFLNGLLLGSAQTFFYFKAVETLPTSVVVTFFYAYPLVTILIDRFFFKLPVYGTTLLAAAVVIVGVAMTSLPGLKDANLDPVGLAFACASPLGYALYIAVAYPATRRVAPFASAMFIYGSLAVAFGSIALSRGLKLPPTGALWLSVLFIGTLGGALQILAFSYALPRLSSSGYALIVSLELVTVVLAGVLVLGEPLQLIQGVGIALVLAGVLFERLMRARRAPS